MSPRRPGVSKGSDELEPGESQGCGTPAFDPGSTLTLRSPRADDIPDSGRRAYPSGDRGQSAASRRLGAAPQAVPSPRRHRAHVLDPAPGRTLRAYSLQSPTVAGERHQLTVQSRPNLGSAESRRLRKQGLIPGVLYGREEPVAIAITERDLRAALTTKGGLNAVLDVVVESGKTHSSVLKDFQQDAVRGLITHVDLQEVRLDQPIHATVPLTLHGDPIGVQEGGVLSQVVERAQRRGAADGGAGAPRGRRLGHAYRRHAPPLRR